MSQAMSQQQFLPYGGRIARDPDGSPVWAVEEGDELVPGARAWQRLGVGLRCETWLAWSTFCCCPVTVKLPRPHQVDHPRAWASLTREVYVLTRAQHPVLPRLYANRIDSDLPHVIMEYVDGTALDDELAKSGALPAAAAALLTAQLLSALVAVHATGAAHLDIKPENIIIKDGRPILLNFGSTRPLGSRQPFGRPIGTLGYAAPEMERCEPISPAMDVYGVGVVLREALERPRNLETPRNLVCPRRLGRPGNLGHPGNLARGGLALRMEELTERLTDPDARTRPTVLDALHLISAAVGPDQLWPSWVDSA